MDTIDNDLRDTIIAAQEFALSTLAECKNGKEVWHALQFFGFSFSMMLVFTSAQQEDGEKIIRDFLSVIEKETIRNFKSFKAHRKSKQH